MYYLHQITHMHTHTQSLKVNLLPNHVLLHQVRVVPHPLREHQSPHGLYRHTQKCRCHSRILHLRHTRLWMDAPLGRRPHGRVGQGGHVTTTGSYRCRGDHLHVHHVRGQLWISVPTISILLLHPSGDTKHNPCHRGGDGRSLVVLPRTIRMLCLGDDR